VPEQVRVTRMITLDDVPALAELYRANRDFLAPFEPVRDDDYYSAEGQLAVVQEALERSEQGAILPHVILDEDGHMVGRITLNGIVRGAFQSCSIGYWLAADVTGRGLATAAVRDIIRVAFDDLGLHRIQGETLLDNVASQRVLERTGFVRFGIAATYLNIAGRWQDCAIYQLINETYADGHPVNR